MKGNQNARGPGGAQENVQQSLDELRGLENELRRDIDNFNEERNRIRNILGSIGGVKARKTERIMNAVFLSIILIFFSLELGTHWLPSWVSLEIGVLLVSIKIVWMIHTQEKYNHFVFWILNTIEFRQNSMANDITAMKDTLERRPTQEPATNEDA